MYMSFNNTPSYQCSTNDSTYNSRTPTNGTKRKLSNHDLKQVTDFIDKNISKKIKIAELASLVDMSKYYFSRLFKNKTGESPYKFITERRVRLAKKLLKNESLSIAEVAVRTGFSSQSQLTTHFKRSFGITPNRYRKKTK